MNLLSEYKKKKDFLICFDSDGCVMNTMNLKHECYFGPHLVSEFGLSDFKGEILHRWNEINLHSMTRGINRFKGLAMILCEINQKFKRIEGADRLRIWTEDAAELSEGELKRFTEKNPKETIFQKALNWSKKVNADLDGLSIESRVPFCGAEEALRLANQKADVAVVSSANPGAIKEEWEGHGLLKYTDIVFSQNDGSKAECISKLLKRGYSKSNVLMCGDAPGDLRAAKAVGVHFFPIISNNEEKSWNEFISTALPRLVEGSYTPEYQEEKIQKFTENLTK